jgi:signal transduction histidine kinase
MTADSAGTPHGILRARLDSSDRLRFADDPLAALQIAAGGDAEGRIAVPQIASVARLARRLKILIARPLLIGADDFDIRLWVRAQPTDDGGVEMQFSDWQEAPRVNGNRNASDRAAEIAVASEGQEWRTDSQMRFVSLGKDLDFARGGEEFFGTFAEEAGGDGYAAAIASRRAFFGRLARHVSSGGIYRLSGHPLFDADGSFLGYRGKASPAQEEEILQESEVLDEAESAELLTTELEGFGIPDFGRRLDIALRMPLGRIIANAETIRSQIEGPLRSDYASYAADIAEAGRHLMELVDDLSDLQAIDRANFTVAQEDVDLADIARRAAGLLVVRAQDRHIRLEAPKPTESAMCIGEFRRALQVAVNLVSNAIRYSPEDSTIWIRAEIEGNEALLIVADQGQGIARDDQERVFEKFERLGREDVAGTGLGLYISRRLARAMHGDIRVDSAPGQGARFILALPVGHRENE